MIQVYTGNGKGKTTASLGMALRILGEGKRVCLIQFMKKGEYAEIRSLKKFKNITIKQFGVKSFVFVNPKSSKKEDFIAAEKALRFSRKAVNDKKYALVILDEINVALKFRLIKKEEVFKLMKAIPKTKDVILTGRYAHDKIIERANLVTEMKPIKHYFDKAVIARKGIEY